MAAGEIVPVVVETVQHWLAAVGADAPIIEGAVLTYQAGSTGIKLAASAVRSLIPVLDRKYAGTSKAAQAAGAANMLAAAERISAVVNEYVAAGRLTPEQGRAALDDPAVAVLVSDRLLDASETNDPMIQDAFAKLVVERMTLTSGTAEAILIRLASERLRALGARQLRLLGAIFTAKQVGIDPFDTRGSQVADYEYYAEQCEIEVRPFWDTVIIEQDFEHLDAANLLAIDADRFQRRIIDPAGSSPMIRDAVQRFPELLRADPKPVFHRLGEWMQGGESGNRNVAFVYTSLKQPGWIIGAVVHSHLRGIPLDLGKWE